MKKKESKKTTEDNSIKERTLKAYIEHIGEDYCSVCASGSGQPAATIKTLRAEGYNFEERSEGQWAKTMFCKHCNEERSHYKLLSPEQTIEKKKRCTIYPSDKKRILKILGKKDAFTGASITSKTEIDHKEPFARLDKDIKIKDLTDEEISNHFQILTPQHNALKEKACKKCIKNGQRPPFMCINYWYEGNELYNDSCVGCGWHDGITWRAKLNNDLEKKNVLIKAYQKYNLFLEEQLSKAYTYANLHGYNCSESDILQGETLRENIREIFYKEI